MERKEKANALLPREELLQAQDAAINITRTVMLGVPSKAKQRIPHLTPDEVAVLLDLIREALQGLASFDVATQYPLKEL
jgi:phage terminase Nu1 subunit (DNA packaging protein)